jgi:hypothetical protein
MGLNIPLAHWVVIPAQAGIQRCYFKCSWVLFRDAGLLD